MINQTLKFNTIDDKELLNWLSENTSDECELIIEANLPKRKISLRQIGDRRLLPSGIKTSESEDERHRTLKELDAFLSHELNLPTTILNSAGAIVVTATGNKIKRIDDNPLVKAIRMNRRLKKTFERKNLMKLTYNEVINERILDEFATVFRDSANAEVLLTAAGFPAARRPNFGNDPFAYWNSIFQQIENGVLPGGFEKLLEAASRQYPANPVFSRFQSSGKQSSTSPSAVKKTIGLKVFLCHATEDKTEVRDIYNKLKNDGHFPWLDDEDLFPGQNWKLEITKQVRNSHAILVFLSNKSVSKTGYVQKEIKMALDVADEQPEGSIFIIPFKLEACEIPERLKHCHWINYYEDKARGYSQLLRALEKRASEVN